MYVNFNILNQLGSPSINSNTFANRPAAGQTGRLFVSTDTFEIYRDNGSSWDLIGGPGTSTITGSGTATQVAYFTGTNAIGSSANLFWDNTNGRLGINTATPGAPIDVHVGTGVAAQLNSTGGSANTYLAFQTLGTTQYRIGYNNNASADYRRFSIYDSPGLKEVISIDQQSRYVGINYQYSSLADQPQYTLDVSGSGRFTDSAYFVTSGTGFVGINTSTPSYLLDVQGTVRAFGAGNTGNFLAVDTNVGGATVQLNPQYGTGLPILQSVGSFPLLFGTNSVERARIDTAGNLGLGVTPNAWSGAGTAMNIGTVGSLRADAFTIGVNNNTFFNGSNWIYQTTRQASRYEQLSGQQIWYNAPSGTAGNPITFTQAMTLVGTSDVKLSIGTTANDGNANYGNITLNGVTGSLIDVRQNGTLYGRIRGISNEFGLLSQGASSVLVLGTNNTEYARITSGGILQVGTNASVNLNAGSVLANSAIVTQGFLPSHQTSVGVLEYNANKTAIRAYGATAGSGFMAFNVGGGGGSADAEAVRIVPNGNVLIGTTTDAGQKLQINGIASVSTTDQSTNRFKLRNQNSGNTWDIVGGLNGANNTDFSIYDSTNAITTLRIVPSSGNATFSGSIQTGAPTTGTAAAWKLGSYKAAAVVVSTTNYIEVDIGGTLYKLAVVT